MSGRPKVSSSTSTVVGCENAAPRLKLKVNSARTVAVTRRPMAAAPHQRRQRSRRVILQLLSFVSNRLHGNLRGVRRETPMLLEIATTAHPATDLGYLLHKNPARVQTFDLAF